MTGVLGSELERHDSRRFVVRSAGSLLLDTFNKKELGRDTGRSTWAVVKVFARNLTHVMPVRELTDPGGLATVMTAVAGFVPIGDCLAGLDWTGRVDAGTGG